MKSLRSRSLLAVVAVLFCLVPVTSQALTPYMQNFEDLIQSDITALANDGWLVFGNVSSPDGDYLYGYGPFPAPNDGFAFCQIDLFQGGDEQGLQQLAVVSDYNNADHANGNIIESNVFQEQTISAADIGNTYRFNFQAKLGNLEGASTAAAFIKTLDPGAGYALTNLITEDMTAIPTTWGAFSIALTIDASLEGQILQFGFMNTATIYQGSAVFYDNLNFLVDNITPVPDASAVAGAKLGQNFPNPFNPMTRIDFTLDKPGNVDLAVYDLAGRRVATLVQASLPEGDHHAVWNGRTDNNAAVAAGRYSYVLRTAGGQVARSMVLVK